MHTISKCKYILIIDDAKSHLSPLHPPQTHIHLHQSWAALLPFTALKAPRVFPKFLHQDCALSRN